MPSLAPRASFRILLTPLVLIAALIGGEGAWAASIAVVLSEARGAYQEFAEAMRAELRRDPAGHELIVMDSDQASTRNLGDAQLVVGVGGKAMEVLASKDFKAPLLLTLIPRSSYEKLPAARREDHKTTGLFIDQPPARYIDLVRAALPDTERIGMLAGRDSRDNVARLAQISRDRKLRPGVEYVSTEGEIYPAIQRLFPDGGVLLATPDTSIFNTQTIPNIILSAYRFRVPVVGFSQGSVKSGALIALFSTPVHLGTQSGEIASKLLGGAPLPAPQFPRLFSVGINAVVARSLGIELESETVIRDRLERMERTDRP
ncbi:ABC transporter substrate binding protein [Uliginosibacterium sp. H3]|uniref:ABC transporter substrate binding protein n=1 Tax=Uliginosibacterium silvisoli TaxID=3114758 RepID=A0ABU6JZ86_9RHOO|nr:ABC transporter substrate binding protein [Uliginosibacterium sp. H3]